MTPAEVGVSPNPVRSASLMRELRAVRKGMVRRPLSAAVKAVDASMRLVIKGMDAGLVPARDAERLQRALNDVGLNIENLAEMEATGGPDEIAGAMDTLDQALASYDSLLDDLGAAVEANPTATLETAMAFSALFNILGTADQLLAEAEAGLRIPQRTWVSEVRRIRDEALDTVRWWGWLDEEARAKVLEEERERARAFARRRREENPETGDGALSLAVSAYRAAVLGGANREQAMERASRAVFDYLRQQGATATTAARWAERLRPQVEVAVEYRV